MMPKSGTLCGRQLISSYIFTPEIAKTSFVAAIDTRQFTVALDFAQTNGVDVNTLGQYSRPALHVAIEYGTTANGGEKLLEFLLKQSTLNVNIRDGLGKTALNYSVAKGNIELTKILLGKLKLAADEKNRIINSLYDQSFRESGCNSGICTFLKNQMPKFTPEVAKSSFVAAIDTRQFTAALELAQKYGIDVNTPGQYSRPALHTVIEYGSTTNGGDKLLEFLLKQNNLNVNVRDGLGKRSLEYATAKGNAELIQKLRQLGAQ